MDERNNVGTTFRLHARARRKIKEKRDVARHFFEILPKGSFGQPGLVYYL